MWFFKVACAQDLTQVTHYDVYFAAGTDCGLALLVEDKVSFLLLLLRIVEERRGQGGKTAGCLRDNFNCTRGYGHVNCCRLPSNGLHHPVVTCSSPRSLYDTYDHIRSVSKLRLNSRMLQERIDRSWEILSRHVSMCSSSELGFTSPLLEVEVLRGWKCLSGLRLDEPDVGVHLEMSYAT